MKRIYTLLYVVFVVLQLSAQNHVEQIREKLINCDSSSVIVVAHRGDWRNFPENSLEAIDNAIKMGVDIVELDVKRTKDGELILMHDRTLDRTTTGKGLVSENTLSDIRKLNLRNGCNIRTIHKVPTLEEALLHAKGKIMINLDQADLYFDQIYELIKDMSPVAFELLFVKDTNLIPKKLATTLNGRSLIWYNTLWDTMAGGHDDDMSLQNPDSGYGYLIDTLGCRIIQTDRPAYLLDYLRKRKLHD